MSTAEQNAGQAPQPGPERGPGVKVRGVYLKDMELPPEVQKEVEDICRERRYRKARDRQGVEEDVKLQYFFGGQTVAYKSTPEGLFIVAVGQLTDEGFTAELNHLPREERCRITLYHADRWHDPTTCILTLLGDEG
jgi:hypothetical protein